MFDGRSIYIAKIVPPSMDPSEAGRDEKHPGKYFPHINEMK